jgi:hypothetical protein
MYNIIQTNVLEQKTERGHDRLLLQEKIYWRYRLAVLVGPARSSTPSRVCS